ncbi:glycosyltransferase involved in cell wall biosynthesis [Rhizobium sp. BK226]|uniref:rhamnan synthesis F family protein n=1 Tax=Rhizobium sp. BK226 TaxID=2587075 RepID=UPI00162078C4|nr:rhamnan synthesis F family protein [Rhizobium sp. BK226]MBB4116321.1 glycosyltransferase involved in cell wall biosynthesis [Rhizobium sp. BK226]
MSSFIELYKAHKTGKSSDKWSFYIPQYDRIFRSFSEKPVRLLSIGVQNCGDLEIYTKYFNCGQIFVGCDINEACRNAQFDDGRVKIVIGDANDRETVDQIKGLSSEFDIIIDDGSHKSSDIIKTFLIYFNYLSSGGVFVIEDLHCSYWNYYEGGIYDNFSSINFFKELIDIINFESFGNSLKRRDLISRFSEKYDVSLDEDVLASVHAIKFVNSMCIVEKKAPQFNLLGARMVVGSEEPAVAGMLRLNGSPLEVPDQSSNYWSDPDHSPYKFRTDSEKKIAQMEDVYGSRFSVLEKKVSELKNENQSNQVKAARFEAGLIQTQNAFNAIARELEMGRRRPHKLLKTLAVYTVFRALLKLAPVIPERRVNWIKWIVDTRNPRRPIPVPEIGLGAYVLPKPNRDCVFVFSHEASRTGAPVLSLNIIEHLSDKYDVVSVIFSGGAIVGPFREKSFFSIELDQTAMTHAEIEQRLLETLSILKPKYAVVNSVASYKAMSALKKARVPSVALVHEFAAYIPVHPYFAEVIDKADRVVFSTELTLETLMRLEHMCRPLKASILPQGQCVAPSFETGAEILEHEDELIRRTFPALEDEIVLVGLGSVNVRKGVDVFLEVARLLRLKNLKQRYRFVWVGDGFSTAKDEYSRFLADQVQRSGLVGMVHFLPALSSIDKIYRAADALILASRLDPLPNVAIDMIANSKAVFCFDKTTGFAEIMQANGFEDCVAEYFSATDMADRIAQTLPNKAAAQQLGGAQNAKMSNLFKIDAYVETIDNLALSAKDDDVVLRRDIETIAASGLFQRDFYQSTRCGLTDVEVIEEYVFRCKSGRLARRALPGFHPFLYAELNNLPAATDPLAHYITSGMPFGPWKCDVIRDTAPLRKAQIKDPRSALHIHAYYVNALEDILSRIEQNANLPDLFISTRKGGHASIEATVSRYAGNVVSIREVPNIGRDIAPLITEFGRELLDYDVIGHVHTKQSLHVAERSVIGTWSNFILGNLLGSVGSPAMFDRILRAFSENEELRMVFPEDPHIMGWTENKAVSSPIAKALGMKTMPENFSFPIGSMFWMKSDLFSKFVGLDLKWQDYPAEPLPIDGSILHALERLFGALPQAEGMKIAVTNVEDLTR